VDMDETCHNECRLISVFASKNRLRLEKAMVDAARGQQIGDELAPSDERFIEAVEAVAIRAAWPHYARGFIGRHDASANSSGEGRLLVGAGFLEKRGESISSSAVDKRSARALLKSATSA